MDQLTSTRSPSPATTPTRAVPKTSLAVWAALLTLYLVWGSTYLGIRVAIDTVPPFLMAAFRFIVAGSILYAVAIRRGDTVGDRPGLVEWRDAAIIGSALLAGGMGLVAIGEQTVPTGIAALLIALLPVWLTVLGRIFFGQRIPLAVAAGIALGFGGIVVLAWPSGAGRLDPFGLVALLISPILWGSGSLYSAHRARLPQRPLVATAMQMLAGGAVASVVAILSGEVGQVRLEAISAQSIIALLYLTSVGSLIGFSTYVWLLRNAPVPLISTYAYVNPVVAVILGSVVLGEAISPRQLLAGAIILVAVAIVVTARGRMRAPSRAARHEITVPGRDRAGLPAPRVAAEP